MRSEFEKNRYWIGLYRSDVDFDESLGEFGRYVSNGSRSFDAIDLEAFNEKWEAYANAWQHQQSKVDELQKRVCAVQRLIEDWKEWSKNNQSHEACIYVEENISELEQALKGENK